MKKKRGGQVPNPVHRAHQRAAKTRQPGPEGEVGLNTWGMGEETIRQVEDMMVIRSGRERQAHWDHPRQGQGRKTRNTPHRLYSHYKTKLNLADWTFIFATCSSVLGRKTTSSNWLWRQFRHEPRKRMIHAGSTQRLWRRQTLPSGSRRSDVLQMFHRGKSVLTNSNSANKQQPG